MIPFVRFTGSARRAAAACACCTGSAAIYQTAQAQRVASAPVEARSFVVRVVGDFGDSGTSLGGAGIVVGADSKDLYIATAGHVVRPGGAFAPRITVLFDGRPADSIRATALPQVSAELDLAVLRIPRRASAPLPTFDRLGDVRALRPGDPVSPMGCPQGSCWTVPVTPDRVVGIDRQGIVFESRFVAPGSSGGALFNEQWEVVGLVTEDEPPRANAIPIEEVTAQLEFWGVPVSMRKPPVPRAGYRMVAGISVLMPIGSSRATDDERRLPSGRASLTRRSGHILAWHASLLRLAPENLGVTAGMAGAALRVKAGRLTFQPFAEAGLGRVVGRFDAGGYYLASGLTDRYVPLWRRVQDDGLGVGGGVSVELVLVPHLVLDLVAARWSFATPANAPRLPAVFFGTGLRIGR